ncbi:cation-translocating P-type ATPase C-terminal domain-containing protein [Erwinia tracheiphila]|nr:cation-translocating P-type ATPase C-terminal domain-containing protein [Erwinia tracheiphila]
MNMATSAPSLLALPSKKQTKMLCPPPRNVNRPVMDGYALCRVGFIGMLIALCAFLLEAWLQRHDYNIEFIHTVLLQTLVTAQWVYMLNCRETERFSLNKGLL